MRVLQRYEQLIAMILVVAEDGDDGGVEQMIELLQSRAAIEEAKGAVVAVRRCSPDETWRTLRIASREFNVKLRDLAAALIEHLGHATPPSPDGVPPIVPTTAAHQAAAALWTALTSPA